MSVCHFKQRPCRLCCRIVAVNTMNVIKHCSRLAKVLLALLLWRVIAMTVFWLDNLSLRITVYAKNYLQLTSCRQLIFCLLLTISMFRYNVTCCTDVSQLTIQHVYVILMSNQHSELDPLIGLHQHGQLWQRIIQQHMIWEGYIWFKLVDYCNCSREQVKHTG